MLGGCKSSEKSVSESDSVNFTRRGKEKNNPRAKQTTQSRDHKGHYSRKQDGAAHGEKAHGKEKSDSKNACYRCGFTGHYAKDKSCPAIGKTCNVCGKSDHFGSMCRTKNKNGRKKFVRQVEGENHSESESDENYVFVMNENLKNEMIHVVVGGVNVMGVVDSGASCNVIDVGTWEKMKQKHVKTITCTTQHNKKVFTYGSKTPLPIKGIFTATIQLPNQKDSFEAEFLVTERKGVPLLGRETSMKLNVLHIGIPNANSNAYSISQSEIKPEEKPEFGKLYTGLGKLNDRQVKIHVKPDAKGVIQNPRRIPFSLRKKVEDKIAELENLDIIEPVTGPTKFQSPIVVVPKPSGDIRICVDMRQANQSVERERFPMPTVEEVLAEMNGSKVFTKLDLNMGFHQLELEEDSRSVTTFTTHKGLYRYKRLMFGVSSAPEIYQSVIQNVIQGCEGSRNMTDDIIVHAETTEEHDKRLEKVLKRLLERFLMFSTRVYSLICIHLDITIQNWLI